MSRIVVIGGVNMDIHLYGVEPSVGQAPIVARHHLAEPGGKGANVARAAARLGADVRLVARIGDDEFGRDCLDVIAADGVDISGVRTTPDAPTGFVAIELVTGHHRSILFGPGANDLLTWQDVETSLSGLGRGDVVIVQAEVPSEVLARVGDWAAATGVPLYLDPTPPDRVTREALAGAEVVTPDRQEAAALVGRADTSVLWPRLAADELLAAGARRVIVKLGAAGALLADASGAIEVPAPRVEMLDETGAGDVFLAALAVRRSEDGWVDAVRFANAAAAVSVSTNGLGLPDHAAVEQAMARMPDVPETD